MNIPYQREANLSKKGKVIVKWWRPGSGDGMSGVDGDLLAAGSYDRMRVLPGVRNGGWSQW